MRRQLLAVIFPVFAALVSAGGASAAMRDAPRSCDGYQLYAPDPVTRGAYTPKYKTITHRMLDAERAELGTITPEMYALLDNVIDDARAKLLELERGRSRAELNTPEYGEKAMAVVDCVLLSHGFVYPARGLVQFLSEGLSLTTYGSNRDLDALIATPHNKNRVKFIRARALYARDFHVADCDIASFVYLAVSEVMNYPVYLVDLSYHAFVRWIADDGRYFNFETMDGFAKPDNAYTVPQGLTPDGGYFKAMSQAEALAYAYVIIGSGWDARLRASKFADPVAMRHIVDVYRQSLALDPIRATAANSLGWFYATVPNAAAWNGAEAVRYAELAASRSPEANVLDTLACAYARNGQFDKAYAIAERVRTAPLVKSASGIGRPKDRTSDFRRAQPAACIDDTYGELRKPFRNGTRGLTFAPNALAPVPVL